MTDLAVRQLSKRFGSVRAVEGLSFDAPAGKVTGFLGPNGAGKTTTLRMLLGLVRPTAGEALIGGVRYERLREPTRTVGAVLEYSASNPGRTGRDQLRVLASVTGVPARRVDEVLEQVDLGDAVNRRVSGYSTGMRQRLGLAAALLGDPKVLDSRRTGQRPGSGRHRLAAEPAPQLRRRGPDDPHLEPRAQRDRPDGRWRRHHQPGTAAFRRSSRRSRRWHGHGSDR